MRTLETLLTQPMMQAMGWALLHSLWQGALVAALLAVAMVLLRGSAPGIRYTLACAALLLLAALPAGTIWRASTSAPGTTHKVTQQTAVPTELTPATESTGPTGGQPNGGFVNKVNEAWRHRTYGRLEALLPWMALAWLLGVMVLSIRLLGGLLQAHHFKRQARHPAAEKWQQALTRLRRQLRITKTVRLVESSLVRVPSVIGWLRPVILLPTSALTGLTSQQLETVLAHELAHIRRHDYLVNLLQTVIETLLFYHPAAWWVSRQVRIEREHACDDLAVAACGDRLTFARALTQLERLRKAPQPQLAVAADGGLLMHRIHRLVNAQGSPSNPFAGLLAGFILIATVMTAGAAMHIPSSGLTTNEDTQPAPQDVKDRKAEDAHDLSASLLSQNARRKADHQPDRPRVTIRQDAIASNLESEQVVPQVTPTPDGQESISADVADKIKALASSNPVERASAAARLGRASAVTAIPSLIQMLGDDTAITPQGNWETGSWTPALQTFKHPSPGEEAALALAAMGKFAVEPLVAILNDTNPSVRRNAAWALGEIRGSHSVDRTVAVEPLIAALRDEDWWVRKAAARALGEIRTARAVGPLVAALEDGNWNVREMAAWALGEMKDARAVSRLSAALVKDERWSVRSRTASALGEIRDPLAVEALTAALNDEDQRVRNKAEWALAEIADTKQEPNPEPLPQPNPNPAP